MRYIVTFSIVFCFILPGFTQAQDASGGYSQCLLDHTPRDRSAMTDDALDILVLACIKKFEQPLNDVEIGKVKILSVLYGQVGMLGDFGLILSIYNGSSYDITELNIVLTEIKTNEQRTYGFNEFWPYIHGIPSGRPAPQYRRFIKALSQQEYMFPLQPPNTQQKDFFKKFSVTTFTASGIR
jgi:hypothetical protein